MKNKRIICELFEWVAQFFIIAFLLCITVYIFASYNWFMEMLTDRNWGNMMALSGSGLIIFILLFIIVKVIIKSMEVETSVQKTKYKEK
jgi:hypothetical protein